MPLPTFFALAVKTNAQMRPHALEILVASVVLSALVSAVFTLITISASGDIATLIHTQAADPQTSLLLKTDAVLTMLRLGEKMMVFAVLVVLIVTVAMDYFCVLSISNAKTEPMAVVLRSGRLLVSMVAVQVWSNIRSFGWIPYIGIIPYTILAPRFIFAPTLLAQSNSGIIASADKSFAITRGLWIHIAWMLSILFLLLLPLMLLGIIAFVAALVVSPVIMLFGSMLGLVSIAYYCFFLKVWLDELKRTQIDFLKT